LIHRASLDANGIASKRTSWPRKALIARAIGDFIVNHALKPGQSARMPPDINSENVISNREATGYARWTMHPTDVEIERLLADCEVRRVKRGGPGGQHRNKTASAVVIRHRPSGCTAEANERRDQSVNLRNAVFRLRVQMALEVRSKRTRPPSKIWESRCRNGRIAVDPTHGDFPRLLAEAIDVIEQSDDDCQAAAEKLGCSTTQLVRLLSMDPRGIALVNSRRAARGLRTLAPRPPR
jgi:hypothetical protein